MSGLNKEFRNLYNPALGAAILLRFSEGYSQNENRGLPLSVLYIVLPMVLQEPNLNLLSGTQIDSGLRKFVAKFSSNDNSMTDLILSFPKRTEEMRDLTERSIKMALMTKLLVMEPKEGILFPNPKMKIQPRLSADVQRILKAANKFGKWCSQLSLFEIGNLLGLEF